MAGAGEFKAVSVDTVRPYTNDSVLLGKISLGNPFVVGDQSLTFWEGTAPATVDEVRNAVIKWVVVRGSDLSGGSLKVSGVELTYVHQSWGVPTSE